MDSKFYISLETARLLKEKGYDRECISYYHDNCTEVDYSFCGERNSTWEERCISAPTKAEAIDWLDENGIVIEISSIRNNKWRFSLYRDGFFFYDSWIHNRVDYSSRLETEEYAIIEACKHINK